MKVIISYPGIPEQVIDARANIETMIRAGKDVPYVRIADFTAWYRFTRQQDREVFEFNHMSLGHEEDDTPNPKTPEQASWKNGRWRKLYGTMTTGSPPRLQTSVVPSQTLPSTLSVL